MAGKTTAAPIPSTPTPTPTLTVAAMTPAQRAELLAELRKTVKDERANLRGQVGEVRVDGNRIWIGVDVGTEPGATGKGVAYLFRTEGFDFKLPDGKTWHLPGFYATAK